MGNRKTQDELWNAASNWDVKHWKTAIVTMEPEQVSMILPLASSIHDPAQWKDKTCAIFDSLSNRDQLEAAGKTLSVAQIITILDHIVLENGILQDKLLPLLVGMPQQTFRELFIQASSEQLSLLKQESISEALQYHLTLLSHELQVEMDSFSRALELQTAEIANLNLDQISRTDIKKISRSLEHFRISGLRLLHEANQTLLVVWHTNRTDLIESFSRIKEQCQKCLSQFVGNPKRENNPATGLWKEFENKLNAVFSDPKDPKNALHDDEPAIEALVKFSIWYVKDYWEIGLLPLIESEDQLELNPKTHSEAERIQYRESLFEIAEKNLTLISLKTLSDLKNHDIYSKRALIEYVSEHRNKISALH